MRDGAGNSLRTAKVVDIRPGGNTFNDGVGKGDRLDFYRINLKRRSRFTLNLTSQGTNADVELIQDRNRNGRVDPGEVVASSRALPGKADALNLVGLPSGTYFIHIFSRGAGTSQYRLSISARTAAVASAEYQIFEQTNAFRRNNGLQPLALNTQLTTAAQNHSRQMALGDFFSHTGSDGSTIDSRIRAAGYQPSFWAENLAAGYTTSTEAVQGWVDSEGHRRNLLAPQLKEIGVGHFFLAQDTGTENWNHYWTQSFAAPI